MGECFDMKKFKIESNDDLWVLVFSKKKLIGCVTVNRENILGNVCIAKNYRRGGTSTQAMRLINKFIEENKGKLPTLRLDVLDKNYKSLLRTFTTYGFIVVRSDDKHTFMTFKG